MKKIVVPAILLFVLVSLSNCIHAQQKKMATPQERADKLTQWMKTNLKLEDNQALQVQGINIKYANKTEQLKNSNLSRQQKLQVLKADDEAKDKELRMVMTEQQFNTYLAKKDEVKKQMKMNLKAKKKSAAY
jgi:hypothetical protein